MVFSSGLFLLYFFPVFLVVYFGMPHRYKNLFLLLASILFFYWGAPLFVFVVLGSVLLDYYVVRAMYKAGEERRKRQWLLVSLLLNLGLLGYFKYFNFFVQNISAVLSGLHIHSLPIAQIALPIGISFFTFKKISYCMDVYRGQHAPFDKLQNYALFILLFPELIAGPIVRFNEIADQITDRRNQETIHNKLMGLFRFSIGLSKKVLIANVVGAEADKLFAADMTTVGTPVVWLGVVAYSFQIYFDFSGYSDMAIGIARMIGFKFPENFDNPYIAQSITDFWRRWHITLGRWMRDYLYIPLGGNKVKTKTRLYFNLAVVFLLSGLWHGASWNFVVWGIFHGFFLIADRIFLLRVYKVIGRLPSIVVTYCIVLIGWVYFRSPDLPTANAIVQKMFAFDFATRHPFYFLNDFYVLMVVAGVLSFAGVWNKFEGWQQNVFTATLTNKRTLVMGAVCYALLMLSISSVISSDFNPFIYYKF